MPFAWRTITAFVQLCGAIGVAATWANVAQCQTMEQVPISNLNVRSLSERDQLPIPTPRPIYVDDAWMRNSPSGNVVVQLDQPQPRKPPEPRPQPPQESPPTRPVPTGNPSPENVPRPGGSQLPPPPSGPFRFSNENLPAEGSTNRQANDTPIDIEFPLGEFFSLRTLEQIGKTRQVITNRKEFVSILGAPRLDGVLTTPADSVTIAGTKLGNVELTLLGETGIRRYRLHITPNVKMIESLVARQFPQSSVEITAAGDHMLVMEGTVESPSEIEDIVALVQNFVGRQGKLINSIKVSGVMQVQLEVVIARVDRSGIRRLGINFEYAGKNGYFGNQIGNLGGITPINSATANNAAAAGGNAFQNVGGTASSVISPASTVFVGVTKELQQFMMQIEALQQQGVAKVLARPTLVTLNGRPAEFLVGGEQPFPYQANAISIPSVEFKKFGTRLNFVPVILGPDKIRLDLVPEVSSVNFTQAINISGNQVPQFITQRIHTTVEMEPGQSLVLGGLLLTESDAQVQKVPFLGDLPGIGVAFRRVRHEERELELIVIVTPRLVHPIDETECLPPLPGDESRRPTDKELFFHGLPEAPHDGRDLDRRAMDDACPAEPVGVKSRQPSPTGTASVRQVSDHRRPSQNSKSWFRMPGTDRKSNTAARAPLTP